MDAKNKPILNKDLIPFFIGFLSFLILCGISTLNPKNIDWIYFGDDASSMYLGWAFFRSQDFSTLAENSSFGLEYASTIAYSGSIPFLAFFFKFFEKFLPLHFQYFGFVIFLCFIFQSFFSWKLISYITNDLIIKICFSIFLITAPIFINKIAGQPILGIQFILLWSIYLYINSKQIYSLFSWLTILIISTAHAYLTMMILPLWFVSLTRNQGYIKKKIISKIILIIFPLIFLLFVMWVSGYFIKTQNQLTSSYGIGRWNTIGFIDSNNWSLFLPDLKTRLWDQSGFSYLGLGLLSLFLIAVINVKENFKAIIANLRNHKFLSLVMLGFTIFAISNNIGIGKYNLDFELNDKIMDLFSTFRASGRFIWPVYYLIIFLIFYQVINTIDKQKIRFILILAVIIQIIDIYPGIKANSYERFKYEEDYYWKKDLKDDFWIHVPDYYDELRLLPLKNYDKNWKNFSYYCYEKKLKTNSTLLARYNNFEETNENYKLIIKNNNYNKDSLYILNNEEYLELAKLNIDYNFFILKKIDDFYIISSKEKINEIFNNL